MTDRYEEGYQDAVRKIESMVTQVVQNNQEVGLQTFVDVYNNLLAFIYHNRAQLDADKVKVPDTNGNEITLRIQIERTDD